MRLSIQVKVGVFLGGILLIAFGLSVWMNTTQTLDTLQQTYTVSISALQKAGYERASNVFASLETGARGSLERGEMEVFNGLLSDLGTISGVKEIGLTNAEGIVVFSNLSESIKTPLDKDLFSAAVSAKSDLLEKETGQTLFLARGHYLNADCLRCHVSGRKGDLSGVLYVRYDMTDLYKTQNGMHETIDAATKKSIFNGLLAGLIGLFAASLGVYLMLGLQVRKPLERLRQVMQALGHGDLTQRLDMQQQDELGETARAADEMATKLNEMVRRISLSSREIGTISEGISDSAVQVDESASLQARGVSDSSEALTSIEGYVDDIAQGVDQLNASVSDSTSSILEMASSIEEIALNSEKLFGAAEEVGSSIVEMAASIDQVAESTNVLKESSDTTASSVMQMDVSIKQVEQNAKDTARISEEVRLDAQTGKDAVEATISGIGDIRKASQITSDVINSLSEKAKNIGYIISVIDDVTEQTNLLALNAAIIAAQAGEHGKGFGVIADEVRELADRTSHSTREIASVIHGVEEETRRAVDAITRSEKSVAEGERLSLQSGQLLAKIVDGVARTVEQVEQIARAAEEQTRGSQMIKEAIEKVSRMVDQNAMATREQSKGASLIKDAVERMKELTSHVKLSTREQSNSSQVIAKSTEQINEMIFRIKSSCDEQKSESSKIVEAVATIESSTGSNLESVSLLNEAVTRLTTQAELLLKEMSVFRVLQDDVGSFGGVFTPVDETTEENPISDSSSAQD